MATSKVKPKAKKTDDEDSEDKPDDETAEGEDSGDETPEQRREQAFRNMIAKRKGGKK
jgi:hypothetical protein